MNHKIFISLTKRDAKIAEALRDLLVAVFGTRVHVNFSTSKKVGEAPGHGEDWFKWIVNQVRECELAYILVTPNSLHKSWIPWEAGAVFGAALASGEGKLTKVRPLIYRLTSEQVPSPIVSSKANYEHGDNSNDIRSLLAGLINDYKGELTPHETAELVKKVDDDGEDNVVSRYETIISAALDDAPVVPTRAVVEEWRIRLDQLLQQDRGSEVDQFVDWMDIAFGRRDKDKPQQLDLRLHSRLADLYLEANNPQKAMQQLDLALQLLPRDIYLLRKLGQAHLAASDFEQAKLAIDRIRKLDSEAFKRNAECAALLGKWYRKQDKLSEAEDVYSVAFQQNRNSYYLADLLAQVRVDQDEPERASDAYSVALEIIDRLEEGNVWTCATAANAAFFTNNDEKVLRYLTKLRDLDPKPSPRELKIIEDGLERLSKKLKNGSERMKQLRKALDA